MSTLQQLPIEYRFLNALRSYWIYIKQTFWPKDLTIFYPHGPVSSAEAQTAGIVLVLITIIVLLYARRARFLATGWFWYLGMLVPVIGLVQVGSQAHADRYTYLPHIGFFIAMVWALGLLVSRFAASRFVIAPVMAVVVAVLAIASNRQVQIWRDSLTLFEHGARVNPKDYLARSILAQHAMRQGEIDEAIKQLKVILQEAPAFPLAELLIAEALQKQGRMEEAIPHLLRISAPDYILARNARLILSYLHAGSLPDAEAAMTELIQLNPRDPAVWFMQAAILRHRGEFEKAEELFRIAIRTGPPPPADNPTLNLEIAELYAMIGEPERAATFYEKAAELGPAHPTTLNNYAWLLATAPVEKLRNGTKAVQLAEKACELSKWEVPVMIGTLAAAYAEAGKFDQAVRTAEKARDLARSQGAEELAARNEELLRLYKEGKAYREE